MTVKYYDVTYEQENDMGHYVTKSVRKRDRAIKYLKKMKAEGFSNIVVFEYDSKKALDECWGFKFSVEDLDDFIQ